MIPVSLQLSVVSSIEMWVMPYPVDDSTAFNYALFSIADPSGTEGEDDMVSVYLAPNESDNTQTDLSVKVRDPLSVDTTIEASGQQPNTNVQKNWFHLGARLEFTDSRETRVQLFYNTEKLGESVVDAGLIYIDSVDYSHYIGA
jgi:hypothetical protein